MYYTIITTKDFIKDYDKIFDFYKKFAPVSFLLNYKQLITSKVKSLDFSPYRFKTFKGNTRVMSFNKNFKIFYEIHEDKKEVLVIKLSLSSQDEGNFFN